MSGKRFHWTRQRNDNRYRLQAGTGALILVCGLQNPEKECTEKCVLAPYFPQDEAKKFMLVHRVFGNGHVIKLLQIIDTACKQEPAPSSSCAACKTQRKKCTEKCVIAPYFPQDKAKKFMLVHRVFANGHVIKLLQDLPQELRGEAVNSMVYEANERLRDPVNGCLGVINGLRGRVAELESQLASTQEAFADLHRKYVVLLTLITGCHEGSDPNFYSTSPQETEEYCGTNPCSIGVDDLDPLQLWDQL